MRDEQLLKQLSVDDLPEPYKTIGENCGMEVVITLAEQFGGSQINFQKLDTILYTLKERLIRQEFNGYNYGELARKYSCSTSWIRKLTTDLVNRERSKPVDGQLSIFDLGDVQSDG